MATLPSKLTPSMRENMKGIGKLPVKSVVKIARKQAMATAKRMKEEDARRRKDFKDNGWAKEEAMKTFLAYCSENLSLKEAGEKTAAKFPGFNWKEVG